MKTTRVISAVAAMLLASFNAQAAFDVSLSINQTDALGTTVSSWNENITSLVAVNADGSFNMKSATSAGAGNYFQNGIFSSSAPSLASHPDYWVWTANTASANGGFWNWHSAETVSGSVVASTTSADPWRTVVNLNDTLGRKSQEIDYDYSAKNNSNQAQTYTFSVVEDINPAVGNLSTVFNQLNANFVNNSGNFLFNPTHASGAQQFLLSSDGINWVDAGVDVGGAYSNPAATPNLLSIFETKTSAGPTLGSPWKMMKLQASFTLSGKDKASLMGLASITAVPEADTLSMMLAGFGLIGFVANRRKKDKVISKQKQ
jgi:PEP-CTERM motif